MHCGWSWGVPAQEQLKSSSGAAQEQPRSSSGAVRSSPAGPEKRWLVGRRGGWAVGGPLWVVVGVAAQQLRSSPGVAQEQLRNSAGAAQEQPSSGSAASEKVW